MSTQGFGVTIFAGEGGMKSCHRKLTTFLLVQITTQQAICVTTQVLLKVVMHLIEHNFEVGIIFICRHHLHSPEMSVLSRLLGFPL